jgi:archaetidylinositol phosphate synthase
VFNLLQRERATRGREAGLSLVPERVHGAWTEAWERRQTTAILACLPAWVTPDHFTFLGLAGSAFAGLCYALSGRSPLFLVGAVMGVALNWLGDTLDGNLARARQCERPRYGFFIDHSCDVLSQLAIFLGIGASPYAHLSSACLVLLAYWMATLMSLITLVATGKFHIVYWGIGPTEIRIALIAGTLLHLLAGPIVISHWPSGPVTLVDLVFAATFGSVLGAYVMLMWKTGQRLYREAANRLDG